MIQQVWSEMTELRNYVSKNEKAELMSLLVKEVQVNQKNSVSVQLNPIANFSEFMVRNNRMSGSGDALRQLAPIVLAAWLVRRYRLAKNGRHSACST